MQRPIQVGRLHAFYRVFECQSNCDGDVRHHSTLTVSFEFTNLHHDSCLQNFWLALNAMRWPNIRFWFISNSHSDSNLFSFCLRVDGKIGTNSILMFEVYKVNWMTKARRNQSKMPTENPVFLRKAFDSYWTKSLNIHHPLCNAHLIKYTFSTP